MTVFNITIGRVRANRRVISPSEARYVESMREQAEELSGAIQAVIDRFPTATREAIKEGLDPIYDLSQEYCPVGETENLINSAFMEDRDRAVGPMVVIGYAKHGKPHYAAIVHERTWVKHAGARASGARAKSAKFLERAVNERIHIFKATIEELVAKQLNKGRRTGFSAGKVR